MDDYPNYPNNAPLDVNFRNNDVEKYDNQFHKNDSLKLDTISSDFTTTPSTKYPHTKAVKVQEAKYKYYEVDGKEFLKDGNVQMDKVIPFVQRNVDEELKKQLPPGQQAAPSGEKGQPAPKKETPAQEKATPAPKKETPTKQPATPAPAPKQEEATPKPAPEQSKTNVPKAGISDIEMQVIELTNVERRKNGLPDLKADTELSNVAGEKSDDMLENNYFSHTSPTYGSPFDMMRDFGVTYESAGENIAQGQPTANEVVQAWMNSEGHRANILSAKFTHIGVGYTEGGNHWTQMFIGK